MRDDQLYQVLLLIKGGTPTSPSPRTLAGSGDKTMETWTREVCGVSEGKEKGTTETENLDHSWEGLRSGCGEKKNSWRGIWGAREAGECVRR